MPTFFQRLFTRTTTTTTEPTTTNARHAEVIERTAQMVRADQPRSIARKHGLEILDLTWEDTGR